MFQYCFTLTVPDIPENPIALVNVRVLNNTPGTYDVLCWEHMFHESCCCLSIAEIEVDETLTFTNPSPSPATTEMCLDVLPILDNRLEAIESLNDVFRVMITSPGRPDSEDVLGRIAIQDATGKF